MRTDRLYAITVYLLNHGRTSGSELAKHFEVSVRTIQRDIDSLCCSGIPVASVNGVNGGYEILERFKMDGHTMSREDYSYILTALKGLTTATKNPQADEIYEKIAALIDKNHMGMVLDFSVLREGDEKLLQRLQSAVLNKKMVSFIYTNNNEETHGHTVEPIAVMYRWYAWYLLAYSKEKEDYRTYKLVRMEKFHVTNHSFTKEHRKAEEILAECDQSYQKRLQLTRVVLHCKANAVHRVREYLKGSIIKMREDGSVLMEISVVEQEQWWLGNLLSLGDSVRILETEHIKMRVADAAKKIVSLYEES